MQAMEGKLSAAVLVLLAVATAATWYALNNLFVPRPEPNEPPLFRHSIPYIGHMIGLLRHGIRYYETTRYALRAHCISGAEDENTWKISSISKFPIYTLNMLNGKVYVVASPELVTAVFRNPKSLAFIPFIAQIGKRLTGHDEATSSIVQHNLNGEHGSGYVIEVHDAIVAALAPGKNLENMTGTMLREAFQYLEALVGDHEIDIFAWTRQMVTICSTTAIYGVENPFRKKPELEVAFWEFDHGLNFLMANIALGFLAPKGDRARCMLGNEFQQYFKDYVPGKTQSSAMTIARHTVNSRHDISSWNQGRLEVGTLLGVLASTIPAISYMLIHIYSDPHLLRDIRNELEETSVLNVSDGTKRQVMIMTIRDKCHLLHSTFQELLRVHAMGASARFVREDVMLNNQYLLKKGMVVQMPMSVLHSDPSAWGPDAKEFQPRRFLKQSSVAKEFKSNQAAYRLFGGGTSLCSGRHFVTLETLALAACMVLRFDMVPANGKWAIPAQKQERLATNVFPPERDIRVKVRKRQGFEAVEWDFIMT